jgi:hypothetical protein
VAQAHNRIQMPKWLRSKFSQALMLLAIVLVIVLAGSAAWAQKIDVQFDSSADFSKYKTFAIRDGKLNSKNPALNGELVQKQIEADIRNDLTTRGLTEAADGPADLNVVYHFGSQRKAEVEAYPAGWRGWGTRYVRVPYAEGTLVIDLRDTGTHSMVWRGIASEEKSNASDIQKKLDNMVKKAIEKYPPKK